MQKELQATIWANEVSLELAVLQNEEQGKRTSIPEDFTSQTTN